MWDEIIVDLFDDIKVELGIATGTHSAPLTSTRLLPDTDQDVPTEFLEEVEEYDVIDGDESRSTM